MTVGEEPYLKAMGADRLAPYYDLLARLGMRERRIKGRVIALAELAPGSRMLDLGCGTGTLVLMACRRHPAATVIGVDGDPTILGIARRKAERAGIAVQLDEGMAYALPYADGSFDAVVSTLTFHHLTPDQQERALGEIRRVLRPGGRLVVADLTLPHNRLMRLAQRASGLLFKLHGSGAAHGGQARLPPAHREGRIVHHARVPAASMDDLPAPERRVRRMTLLEHLLATSGWRNVAPVEHSMSMMGTIGIYTVTPPDEAPALTAATGSAAARAPR